jgi:hypothetical protein
MNRLRRTSEGDATLLGCWTGGGSVRSVYAPEPPSCAYLRVWRWSVREPSFCARRGGRMAGDMGPALKIVLYAQRGCLGLTAQPLRR